MPTNAPVFTCHLIGQFARTRASHALSVARWACLLVPMAAVVGSLCALFLWALDAATGARFAHPWLLFGLPVVGFLVTLAYQAKGKAAEGGNNLLMDQIHEPGGGVPLRMAPFILVATVVTHLCGGSVGREGTAVQMGGSIASGFAKHLRLDSGDLRVRLMAGIAAGFGAVFGTPIAGAIFALEVLTVGKVQYEALTVTTNEVGMIRIYLKPGERSPDGRLKSIFSARPMYRRIVQEAKEFGIMNAVAHQAHYC